MIQQLIGLVPAKAHGFRAVEVAATVNAITKLGIGQDRALRAMAAVVKERATEFRARQMAQVLHAFSSLTLSYGRLLQDVSPQVLAGADTADDQSLVLLFCAYARA